LEKVLTVYYRLTLSNSLLLQVVVVRVTEVRGMAVVVVQVVTGQVGRVKCQVVAQALKVLY
jgi:hypothetical protein